MQDQAERLRQMMGKMQGKEKNPSASVPSGRSRVIAVTSGKGGVGKTNVSVNLALAMGGKGKRVLLFDADMGLANVDVMFGLMPSYTLLNVLNGQKGLHEILVEGPEGIRIIASGSGGVQELADLSETQRSRFLDALLDLRNESDVILIDTGAGLHRNVLAFALSADEVLVVTTPEPTALMDAYGMIKILHRERKNPLIRIVVNMASNQGEADEAGKKLVILSKRFLDLDVEYRGFIPRDMGMVRAVKEQKPILLSSPMSPAALQLTKLADSFLTGIDPESDGNLLNFFKRVTHIFGAKGV